MGQHAPPERPGEMFGFLEQVGMSHPEVDHWYLPIQEPPAGGGAQGDCMADPLLDAIENLSHFHRVHEKFCAQQPRHRSRRASRPATASHIQEPGGAGRPRCATLTNKRVLGEI